MRTVVPRWVTAVEGAAPHSLQIPTSTWEDKQDSKWMKPFLPWFSGARPSGISLDFYILWDFIQKISFAISFFGEPFLRTRSWGKALQTCGTHYSLFTWPAAGISASSHWVFMTHQDGKIKRNTACGINQAFFSLLLLFFFSLSPRTLAPARLSAEGTYLGPSCNEIWGRAASVKGPSSLQVAFMGC